MENYSKWLLFGSIGAGIVGGLAYLFTSKQTVTCAISREDIVKFLQDFKSQTLSQNLTNANVIKRIIAETGGKSKSEDGTPVGEYIRGEVQILFDQKKQMLLLKHNINEEELADALESSYKNDEEINKLIKTIYDDFENGLKGISPSIEVRPELYQIITKEVAKQLTKKILIMHSKSYIRVFDELSKEEGDPQISISNPKFIRKVGQLNLGEKKRQLIEDEGINVAPDSPTEVLGKVNEKYKQEDPEYNQAIKKYDEQFSYIIDRLGSEITTEEQIDEVFNK